MNLRTIVASALLSSFFVSSCGDPGGVTQPSGNPPPVVPPASPDSTIVQILSEISLDSLQYSVRELSGDVGIVIDGIADTIDSRTRSSDGHAAAIKYLTRRLQSYGLTVQLQSFFTTGTNVLATQPGTESPNHKYLIGAHFDNRETNRLTVPGADDNASGTAAVLEAARLLSRYQVHSTIVYAFWDEEELGLRGSGYYTVQALANHDSIFGVVNVDMIGWDSNNDGLVELHSNLDIESSTLAATATTCNRLYAIGLKPAMYVWVSTSSDYASFWRAGFNAVGFSEAYWASDFNPRYHTSSDSLAYFNLTYFHNCSKLAIATIATLACAKRP